VGVRIGVLALQGDVSEHIDGFSDAVRAFGSERSISVVQIRKPEEITGLDVLAIPGGESITFSRLVEKNRLFSYP